MRSQITIFDRTTGQIVGWRRVAMGREAILLPEQHDWIAGYHDDGKCFIDPATCQPVPLKTFVVTVEANRVTGIPAGVAVLINARDKEIVDDGEITIEAAYPQTIEVILTHPLYEPVWLEVPCGPAQT